MSYGIDPQDQWLEAQRRAEEERQRRLEEERKKAEEARKAQEAEEAQEAQEAEEAREAEEAQQAQMQEESIWDTGTPWAKDNLTAEEIEEQANEWEDIEPEKDQALGFLWETGTSSYVTSDGSRIQVSDTEGVIVRQNKVTGEIVVVNAKDAQIDASRDGIKISIIDSSVKGMNTSDKDDEIYFLNSEVQSLNTKNGDDKIVVDNSNAKTINSGNGEDNIKIINGSTAYDVNTGNGADKVLVDKSVIENDFNMGNGTDDAIISNSIVYSVNTGNDADRVLIRDHSAVGNLFNYSGDDVLDLMDSSVDELDLLKSSTVYAYNSNIGEVDAWNSKSTIINDNSVIGEFEGDGLTIRNDKYETHIASNPATLDETTQVTAVDIAQQIAQKYANGELTPEQETQALVINFFANNAASFQEQFENQELEDGVLADGYNLVKQLLDLGVSKGDIQRAISEQNQMILELTQAMNGEGSESFEDVFKKWTGIEYNEEAMTEFMETYHMYQLATTGMNKVKLFQNEVKKATNFQGVFNAYVKYYGSEERAREELNKNFAENAVGNQETGFAAEMYINENNELVRVLPDTYGASGPTDDTTYTTLVEPMSDITNMFATMPRVFNVDDADEEYARNFENATGISINELTEQYLTAQLKATGNGSAFQRLIDKYCEEQEGFADKISMAVTTSGMIMMAGGAVICIACPPASGAGLALMKAGQVTVAAGIFSDEVIGAADEVTSGNIDWDEMKGYLKEGITDAALYLSGRGINVISGGVNGYVFAQTGGDAFLAKLAEIGIDAPMSLMADLIITGEVNLSGEGISQLMAILSGIAGSKLRQCNVDNPKPTKPANAGDPAKPTGGIDPTKPANAGDPAKPADAGDPAKPADAGDPAKPADAGDPAKPADGTDSSKPQNLTPEQQNAANILAKRGKNQLVSDSTTKSQIESVVGEYKVDGDTIKTSDGKVYDYEVDGNRLVLKEQGTNNRLEIDYSAKGKKLRMQASYEYEGNTLKSKTEITNAKTRTVYEGYDKNTDTWNKKTEYFEGRKTYEYEGLQPDGTYKYTTEFRPNGDSLKWYTENGKTIYKFSSSGVEVDAVADPSGNLKVSSKSTTDGISDTVLKQQEMKFLSEMVDFSSGKISSNGVTYNSVTLGDGKTYTPSVDASTKTMTLTESGSTGTPKRYELKFNSDSSSRLQSVSEYNGTQKVYEARFENSDSGRLQSETIVEGGKTINRYYNKREITVTDPNDSTKTITKTINTEVEITEDASGRISVSVKGVAADVVDALTALKEHVENVDFQERSIYGGHVLENFDAFLKNSEIDINGVKYTSKPASIGTPMCDGSGTVKYSFEYTAGDGSVHEIQISEPTADAHSGATVYKVADYNSTAGTPPISSDKTVAPQAAVDDAMAIVRQFYQNGGGSFPANTAVPYKGQGIDGTFFRTQIGNTAYYWVYMSNGSTLFPYTTTDLPIPVQNYFRNQGYDL